MFSLILNIVGTLLHGYCTWRLGSLPWIVQHVGRHRWWAFSLVLWLAFITGVQIGDEAVGRIPAALSGFAFHWLAALFLLSVPVFAVDVFSLGRWRRMQASPLRSGAVLLGAALVGVSVVLG